MSTVAQNKLTAEEFAQLPEPADGSKQELVRGEVITMAPPGVEHGEVQGNVYFLLKQYARQTKAGRVNVESGVVTERGDETVRGPDVSFYSRERLAAGVRVKSYHDQPPDLCVEVVSPSNTRALLFDKVKEYLFCGVRVVWLVDPEDRSVTVYTGPDEGRLLHETAEIDGGEVLPGFRCKVAEFFAE